MTPGARVAAAITVLDQVLDGQAAEKALTNWARSSRFAGSKDRAAVRDHVFGALRRRRSCGAFDGDATARIWMGAYLKSQDLALDEHFDGVGHAPEILDNSEHFALQTLPNDLPDVPAWCAEMIQADHGDTAGNILEEMQNRAPVGLRVNLQKSTRDAAMTALAADGITTRKSPLSPSALIVEDNPRRVKSNVAFLDGRVEVQDAASQSIADLVPIEAGDRVLDYCAGGGGKTLAMAGRATASWFAHDISAARLNDINPRAERAGVSVTCLATEDLIGASPFDVVVCDAPCSGSGAWRRTPDARWKLTPEDLKTFTQLQLDICQQALALLKPGGIFAYFTCSVFAAENQNQRLKLESLPEIETALDQIQTLPTEDGDGLYGLIARKSA